MRGIELIEEERKRQIEKEGFDSKHDFEHRNDDLALAGAVYALPEYIRLFYKYEEENGQKEYCPLWWPFEAKSFKPTPNDRKRELVKAGALIAAEIDRIIEQENFESWEKEKEGVNNITTEVKNK